MGLPFSSLYYLDKAWKMIPIWIAEEAGTAATTAQAVGTSEDSESDELGSFFVCFILPCTS